MEIRPFLPDDTAGCLAIFDSNLAFLTLSDRTGLEAFLRQPAHSFVVMEHERELVGCGGFTAAADATESHLLWGMIRGDCQRQGLGRFLLMFRLREIGKLGKVELVIADIPPLAIHFFEREGFRNAGARENGRIRLVKRLSVCS